MVSHRPADSATPQPPIAPVVKRKRRTSCLGEEERRERKRAIDREAQRSLREKTRTHIAELERTIEILRNQDRNGATANLLAEIDVLRAENERLRNVVESVKAIVGFDMALRNTAPANAANADGQHDSPPATSAGRPSSKLPTPSSIADETPCTCTSLNANANVNPPTCLDHHQVLMPDHLDLDGMNMMIDVGTLIAAGPNVQQSLPFQPLLHTSEEDQIEEVQWSASSQTPSWITRMEEAYGLNLSCPSPTTLHVGVPNNVIIPTSGDGCHLWLRLNELFSKVFSHCPQRNTSSTLARIDQFEVGLLYMGIKNGWDSLSLSLSQSPALTIIKEVDQAAFSHLPKTCRLATLYKSFKLLKYYLNATKEQLGKVPAWLRPSMSQASTQHPIIVDFFAWPTLRSRFLAEHATLGKNSELGRAYTRYLRFEWPFAFEDAFFLDNVSGTYRPSPLFERYHRDLKYWKMDEAFYHLFPQMRADIEGDRNNYGDVNG
ncbi:uncharacterized protein SETTUDRAFT_177747 [Exserohilum turcica Et28A]|uniref:BZIP transcription factor n=1 Tax=Exserohilum turcicum (strain 28A) TaxID=671987 RepID=R0JXP7_EXST2|nr:uncharacterized protein SETTUDRAFT_177747 [Exserohilum turcica Et28A]EOA85678.1 hypothetical protein SETTUDRAFT_177747 [Exserohilum turcica Et28A]